MARPLVVGTLTGEAPLASQLKQASSQYIDIVEVRLDTFPWMSSPFSISTPLSQNLLKKVRSSTKKPVLLTLRSFTECGKNIPLKSRLNDRQRLTILARLLPWCDWVDVEIRHLPLAKVISAAAHQKKKRVIHSYHQFSGRFRMTDAARWAKKSSQLHGDVFKVAMTPQTNEELEKFLSWGQSLKVKDRVLIGMGKVGLISRFIGYSFGSSLTYGHLGRSAAPGQVVANILGKTVRKLYANAQ